MVALEGQGQDELFEVLSGSRRPSSGEIDVNGTPVSFGHPSDAIRAGLLYVPADRTDALLMQRSVRENIALPSVAPFRRWGPIRMGDERSRVKRGVDRPQIDTRASEEVRRLSGGNQQKVTIARWIAAGVQTLLCFDPTRGIDIRTKREIYLLLRELAAGGAAVLLYTSELEEIQLACDRAIVIFGGAVVDEIAGTDADEATLLRAARARRGRTRDRSDERAERPGGAGAQASGSADRGAGMPAEHLHHRAARDAGRTACVHPRDQADVRRVRPRDAVEGRVAAGVRGGRSGDHRDLRRHRPPRSGR